MCVGVYVVPGEDDGVGVSCAEEEEIVDEAEVEDAIMTELELGMGLEVEVEVGLTLGVGSEKTQAESTTIYTVLCSM